MREEPGWSYQEQKRSSERTQWCSSSNGIDETASDTLAGGRFGVFLLNNLNATALDCLLFFFWLKCRTALKKSP